MKASEIGDVNIVKMLIGAGASLRHKAKVSSIHVHLYAHSASIIIHVTIQPRQCSPYVRVCSLVS